MCQWLFKRFHNQLKQWMALNEVHNLTSPTKKMEIIRRNPRLSLILAVCLTPCLLKGNCKIMSMHSKQASTGADLQLQQWCMQSTKLHGQIVISSARKFMLFRFPPTIIMTAHVKRPTCSMKMWQEICTDYVVSKPVNQCSQRRKHFLDWFIMPQFYSFDLKSSSICIAVNNLIAKTLQTKHNLHLAVTSLWLMT